MNKRNVASGHGLAIVGLILAGLGMQGCVVSKPQPAPSAAQRTFDPRYTDWNFLLTHYVTANGADYARMKRERAEGLLEIAMTEMAQVTPAQFEGWSREMKLALLINAHNAHAMARVLRHYPVKSLGATAGLLGSARGVRNIRLLGREWSLAGLAGEITGYPYHESRAIFLLNWAARGCAPLPQAAVTGQNLEATLERQTRAFMSDSNNSKYDQKKHILYVSRLIKWYDDAIARDYQTQWDFVRRYLPKDVVATIAQRKSGPRIRWLPFEDGLNDTAGKQ